MPASWPGAGGHTLVALDNFQGVFCAHGEKQRQGHQDGGNPDKGDEQLHLAGPGAGFELERVADGSVPLKAESGHVQHGGIAAGFKKKAVQLAGHVAIRGGEGAPDGAVKFHGHSQQDDQEVRAGQAHHVVRHFLLQVAFLLQDPGGLDGDAVPHDSRHKDDDIDDGQHDLNPQSHLKLLHVAVIDHIRTV